MPIKENYDKQTIEYLLNSDIFQDIDNILEDWNRNQISDDDCLKLIGEILDKTDDDNGQFGHIVNDFYEQIDNILLALDDDEILPEDAIDDIDDIVFDYEEHELVKKIQKDDYSLAMINRLETRIIGDKKEWNDIKKKLKHQNPLEPQQIEFFDEKIKKYKQILKKKRTWRIKRIQKLQKQGIGENSKWESMLETLQKDKEITSLDMQYFLIKSKEERRGIVSTTPSVQGYEVVSYLDIVSGHAVVGLMFLKDSIIGLTDFFGGRSGIMERNLRKAKEIAIKQMTEESRKIGANAVISVTLDYSPVNRENKSMLMVSATGTAVIISPSKSGSKLT